jgi:hypothetical protein
MSINTDTQLKMSIKTDTQFVEYIIAHPSVINLDDKQFVKHFQSLLDPMLFKCLGGSKINILSGYARIRALKNREKYQKCLSSAIKISNGKHSTCPFNCCYRDFLPKNMIDEPNLCSDLSKLSAFPSPSIPMLTSTPKLTSTPAFPSPFTKNKLDFSNMSIKTDAQLVEYISAHPSVINLDDKQFVKHFQSLLDPMLFKILGCSKINILSRYLHIRFKKS